MYSSLSAYSRVAHRDAGFSAAQLKMNLSWIYAWTWIWSIFSNKYDASANRFQYIKVVTSDSLH